MKSTLTLLVAGFVLIAAMARAETTLTGRVFLPGGNPATDTRVRLYYYHDLTGYGSKWLSETKTDDRGNFKIARPDFHPPPVLPQSPTAVGCYLVADHAQCAMAIADLIPDKNDGYQLWLDTPHRVGFTIVDKPAGNPVKGVDVALLLGIGRMFPLDRACRFGSQGYPEKAYQQIGREVYCRKSGEDGSGEFANAFYGARLVEVYAPDTGGYDFIPWNKDTATTIRAWSSPMIYHGKVIDAKTGAPLPNVLLRTTFGSWELTITPYYAVTDVKGEYTIRAWPHEGPGQGKDMYAIDLAAVPEHAPKKVTLFEGRGLQPDVDIAMTSGTLVSGIVTDQAKNKQIAGVIVMAGAQNEWDETAQYRVTDAQGRYAFRIEGDAGFVQVTQAPMGYVVLNPARRADCELRGEKIEANFAVTIAVPRRQRITFKDANGKGVAALEVSVAPRDVGGGYRGTTDGAGNLDLVGLGLQSRPKPGRRAMLIDMVAQGEMPPPISAFALSRDDSLGAFATFTSDELAAGKPLEAEVQPTHIVEVVMQDENGNELAGTLSPNMGKGGVGSHLLHSYEVPDDQRSFVARIPCLPNMHCSIMASASDNGGHGFGILNFTCGANDEPGRQIIKIKGARTPTFGGNFAPPFTSAPPQLEEPKDALWKKQDSVDTTLTWYALKSGVAFVDSQRREVKRFADILGEAGWVANGIAFGKDKVWLGMNKGLLAWDRKLRSWSRFAIGGELIDAPVNELSLTNAGVLKVTVQEDGKAARQFEYDTQSAKWTENK